MSWPGAYESIFEAPDAVASFLSQKGPNVKDLDCLNITGVGCPPKCADPGWVFGSVTVPSPVWSCSVWPNVTERFLAGRLSDLQDSFLFADHVDITPSSAKAITLTISDCLMAYCENLEGCDSKGPLRVCSTNAMVINGSMLNIDAVSTCIAAICDHQHQTYANPDIAGIGVVKAYIIQLAIVSVGILMTWCLHLLHWWRVRLTHAAEYSLGHLEIRHRTPRRARVPPLLQGMAAVEGLMNKQHGPYYLRTLRSVTQTLALLIACLRHFRSRQCRRQSRLYIRDKGLWLADRTYVAWLAALPEFLKAQCFFASALSVAAMTSILSGARLSPIDQSALWAASHSGLSPVGITFCLLSAVNWKRPSWYLLIITSATWIVSLYVASLVRFQDPQTNLVSDSQWPDACANAPPTNMCGAILQYKTVDQSDKYLKAIAMFGIGAGLVTISQLARLIYKKKILFTELEEAEVGTTALFFYQLPMFCMFFGLQNITAAVGNLYQNGAVDTDWTFGQIVAVTVWLPPLTAFLKTLFDGLPNGPSKMLPMGFATFSIGGVSSSYHDRSGHGR